MTDAGCAYAYSVAASKDRDNYIAVGNQTIVECFDCAQTLVAASIAGHILASSADPNTGVVVPFVWDPKNGYHPYTVSTTLNLNLIAINDENQILASFLDPHKHYHWVILNPSKN